MSDLRWWRGARGEWYVVLQFALFALIVAGPATVGPLARWPVRLAPWLAAIGLVLAGAGALLAYQAARHLSRNLTPLPEPKPGGRLIVSGPYRFARHPIYGGVILVAMGYALALRGWLTLGYVMALIWLLTLKIRFEERRLASIYPEYAGYRRTTRRFVPFVY
jgi:protein-S-isoprenylcysteine O-methyltransferase Ste14